MKISLFAAILAPLGLFANIVASYDIPSGSTYTILPIFLDSIGSNTNTLCGIGDQTLATNMVGSLGNGDTVVVWNADKLAQGQKTEFRNWRFRSDLLKPMTSSYGDDTQFTPPGDTSFIRGGAFRLQRRDSASGNSHGFGDVTTLGVSTKIAKNLNILGNMSLDDMPLYMFDNVADPVEGISANIALYDTAKKQWVTNTLVSSTVQVITEGTIANGDRIQVPTGTSAEWITYQARVDRRTNAVTWYKMVNNRPVADPAMSSPDSPDVYKIPAGTGFWYTHAGSGFTINWPLYWREP